jgi:hypothetical protein
MTPAIAALFFSIIIDQVAHQRPAAIPLGK